MNLKKSVGAVLMLLGITLLLINLYGLTQSIRPSVIFADELRFDNDVTLSLEETLNQIERHDGESDIEYAERITEVIGAGLAHIHWRRYDSRKFNQLIPIWENYFLYAMGKLSGIKEFERYHYADYKRSLERGIGICGDASMIMSQLLAEQGIDNQLLTFPGHVIVAAEFENGQELAFDPDFGVALEFSPAEIQQSPSLTDKAYLNAGYPDSDIEVMNRIYGNDFERWNGVQHFITKKYYFEYVTYWLKWPFPLLLIVFSYFLAFRKSIK